MLRRLLLLALQLRLQGIDLLLERCLFRQQLLLQQEAQQRRLMAQLGGIASP